MSDPYLQQVVLQLNCEDNDGSGIIRDTSRYYNNIIKTGNFYFDTAIKRVGNSSLKVNVDVNNGIGNRLAITTDVVNKFSFPGDFTIRLRFRPIVVSIQWGTHLIDTRDTGVGTSSGWALIFGYPGSNNKIHFYYNGISLFSDNAPVANTWYDLDIVRIGTTVSMYIGGTKQSTTATIAGTINVTNFNMFTSCNLAGGTEFIGHIDAIRIINGSGIITEDYTVDFLPYEDAPPPTCTSLDGLESLGLVSASSIEKSHSRILHTDYISCNREVPGALNAARGVLYKSFSSKVLDLSGNGMLTGKVLRKGTPNTPYYAKLRLMEEATGIIVQCKTNDPITGDYLFDFINMNSTYSIIAHDVVNNRSAVISSNRKPVKMP